MNHFNHYIEQIPENIYNNSKVYASEKVALLMPKGYISDVSIITEDYHITLPIENPPPIVLENKDFEFGRNKIIIFNPNVEVFCKKNDTATSRYYTITIKRKFLNEVAEDMGFDKKILFTNVENPFSNNIRQAILNFKQEIDNHGNSSSMMKDSFSIQIAATILREIQSNFNNRDFTYTVGDCYVKRAQEFIDEFYNSDITIIDICREIHISPYHFIRLFKKKVGMTPHEYLLNLRIDNAKKMIKINEESIMIISKKCGFINNAHFSTTFKRLTGLTPVEYKKMI